MLSRAASPVPASDRGDVGRVIRRRLWPAGIALLALIAWLRVRGESAGLWDARTGVVLLAALSMLLITVILWGVAAWASRIDERRRRAETALAGAEARLAQVQRLLIETQERERGRIAVELHDRIGQNLTALAINLNAMGGSDADRVSDSLGLVQATMERVRDVIGELRPAVLDDHGLAAALRWYAGQLRKRAGLAVAIESRGAAPGLPPAAATAMFRIAQEALTNTLKHTPARRAALALEAGPSTFTLTVSDEGPGFDVAQASGGERAWGLAMMRERAEAAGLRLRVESAPGAGTRVCVSLDLSA